MTKIWSLNLVLPFTRPQANFFFCGAFRYEYGWRSEEIICSSSTLDGVQRSASYFVKLMMNERKIFEQIWLMRLIWTFISLFFIVALREYFSKFGEVERSQVLFVSNLMMKNLWQDPEADLEKKMWPQWVCAFFPSHWSFFLTSTFFSVLGRKGLE